MALPTNVLVTKEEVGFTSVASLLKALVTTLLANGFTKVYPTADYTGVGTVMLDPTLAVDPLYTPPPANADPVSGPHLNPTSWRLAITATDTGVVTLNVATSVQLIGDLAGAGTIATAKLAGEPKNPGEITNFIDRSKLLGIEGNVYPMSYLVTVTDHGLFLAVWDQSMDEYQDELTNVSPSFRWVVIQRPVEYTTGKIVVDGRQPVFCVYTKVEMNLSPIPTGASDESTVEFRGTKYFNKLCQVPYKFVVRESDIIRPSLTHYADANGEDSSAIFNSSNQVSVSETNRYVVTIPKGLTTTRYAYTHELDMIAYTSADVIGQWSEIVLDVYNPTSGVGIPVNQYSYKSLISNRIKNTGVRILVRVVPTPVVTPVSP